MTTTLPLFPLELVAFPGEKLALHIFEDRYRQLIEDCEDGQLTFGIPTYINKGLQYGTEMRLSKIVKRYPSGASDIICHGLRVFEISDFMPSLENKLYSGAGVRFLEINNDYDRALKNKFSRLLSAFYNELEIDTPSVNPEQITSFSLAHKMGLSLDQEYELLQIIDENKRLQFLIDHLEIVLPTVLSVNRTKELIKLNGHFKNFDPLDFEDYIR